MGNFFQKLPEEETDRTLIEFLRNKSLTDVRQVNFYMIQKIQDLINDQYPATSILNFNEFEDIFGAALGPRLEQVFLLLQNEHKLSGAVDIYESLTVLIIFCREVYSIKLADLFQMFDFDQSQNIELKELVLTIQTTIRALCKIVNLSPPDLKTLEVCALKLFSSVDSDQNKRISYQEFEDWICTDFDLQDFLLKFAAIQTPANARRRGQSRMEKYQQVFLEESQNSKEVDPIKLQVGLANVATHQLDYIMQILSEYSDSFATISDMEHGKINEIVFYEVMNAVAAFESSDINNDNAIQLNEFHYLIIVLDEKILTEEETQQIFLQMDKNKHSFISLQDWIQYLRISDAKTLFQSYLKHQFQKQEDSHNGLNNAQVQTLLKNLFQNYLSDQHNLDVIIIELLKDQAEKVNLIEFLDFSDKLIRSIPELEKFL